jgi:non-heme chloroperoxidase
LKISHAIFNGEERYTEIKCPALVLFRKPVISTAKPGSDAADAKLQAARDAELLKDIEDQAKAFEAAAPNVRIVMLPGANHYIFRSNEADVLREMNAFITTLP